MLAASAGAWSQTTNPANPAALPTVTVRDTVEAQGKDDLRTTTTNIGKGRQELRDIPQSITVVPEKLIDDRNLDTLKEALRNTAGITFMAAEGGEEDIRLRGFSLAASGDIFLDGLRDPAFYDRDTFNMDRIEVMRGSASMLFGRGSTGGAVNQVSKVPRLINEHEVSTTVGSHDYGRITGDFNFHTSENAGARLNVMKTKADNNGAGSSIDKDGVAGSYRWGIGTADEFIASAYYLNNNNGINYGLPWIKPTATASNATNTLLPNQDPDNYYGLASDYNAGLVKVATLGHLHRFTGGSELRTVVRKGSYDRDQRASAIRFGGAALQPPVSLANFGPNTILTRGNHPKVQNMQVLQAQSDFSSKFDALGYRNELLTGVDFSREAKAVYTPSAVTKPTTLVGTPDDGDAINEGIRTLRNSSGFVSKAWGAYAQDMVHLTPTWKVVGGLRYDHLNGNYETFNAAQNPSGAFEQTVAEWSKRVGVLYQPDAFRSFHFSYGTSFNTSGDTYSYSAATVGVPPEESENIELGAKFDSADRRYSTRLAIFRSTKKNERNTDPDTAPTLGVLSAKRHTAGFEIDLVGRLTARWEVFGSYMWAPIAKVDQGSAQSGGNRTGDRPGLTPKHSGTIWTTYQLTPQWRVGGGLNFRSEQSPADAPTPQWYAPGFGTADLMAEYRINDMFTVKANLTNIADKYYAESVYRGHYIPGVGRNLQVSLNARF